MKRALVLRFEKMKPVVIMETDKSHIFKQYSADKLSDDGENLWFKKNGKASNLTLEMIGHGWTMYDQQLVDYDGDGKTIIDEALKELGINKP